MEEEVKKPSAFDMADNEVEKPPGFDYLLALQDQPD